MNQNSNQDIIDRINELARKAKGGELTPAEVEERALLRKEYLQNFRKRFTEEILDNIYIVEEDGEKTKLLKKD